MGTTKEKIKMTVDDFKKMKQKSDRRVRSVIRHKARPSEYSKKIKRMSNIRLQAEALSKHKKIGELENDLQLEKSKFIEIAVTLGILTHPQINYDLRDLLMDGVQSPTRTDYDGVLICKEDDQPTFLRTGDQEYWKKLELQCGEGHVLTDGQFMSVEHYENVYLSDAVLLDPEEENLSLEELKDKDK
ncbi:hypothetical protein LCGC14_0742330 [marine sediment metagenome]|uniref:Uncharacterized protein n=1 Tax=marine sediment metagenome TaxID=412755 RepID=A0A0F9Q6B8_9ZZZZ